MSELNHAVHRHFGHFIGFPFKTAQRESRMANIKEEKEKEIIMNDVRTEGLGFVDGFPFGARMEPFFGLDLFYEGIADFGSYVGGHLFVIILCKHENQRKQNKEKCSWIRFIFCSADCTLENHFLPLSF